MGKLIDAKFLEFSELEANAIFDKRSEGHHLLQKCKQVARVLKAQRTICQPVTPNFRDFVPPRHLSDKLMQLYLRTFETVFRVLHLPTFHSEYLEYWNNPEEASDPFVLTLLLIMAIGTCFHQDPGSTEDSLRDSSAQWIYAAQTWLSAPFGKRRLGLLGIQIYCLLIFARLTNAVEGDLTWITVGSLVRTAMAIGLHRDPAHFQHMSSFHSELRRRLWATTMEIAVQSSLDAGMPPLISCEDYDCDPPSNFDDAQIDEVAKIPSAPKPADTFTQSSIQCALMRSLPIRIKVSNALNGVHSDISFEDTVQVGAELTKACRINLHLFQSFHAATASSDQARPTSFQIKLLDFLNRRFLLSLHMPFAQKANSNIAYSYSRRVCLEASLQLLSYYTNPAQDEDDYLRLGTRGYGMFKNVLIHACLLICAEIIRKLREDPSPIPVSRAQKELYPAIQDSVDITRHRILLGETSVKAYVCFACALGHIEAMQSGTSSEQSVSKAAMTSLETCHAVLKERAERIATLPLGEIEHGQCGTEGQGDLNGFAMSDFPVSSTTRHLISWVTVFADGGSKFRPQLLKSLAIC